MDIAFELHLEAIELVKQKLTDQEYKSLIETFGDIHRQVYNGDVDEVDEVDDVASEVDDVASEVDDVASEVDDVVDPITNLKQLFKSELGRDIDLHSPIPSNHVRNIKLIMGVFNSFNNGIHRSVTLYFLYKYFQLDIDWIVNHENFFRMVCAKGLEFNSCHIGLLHLIGGTKTRTDIHSVDDIYSNHVKNDPVIPSENEVVNEMEKIRSSMTN